MRMIISGIIFIYISTVGDPR